MQKTVVVGSDKSCDFPVAFDGVSSRHCRLIFDDGRVWLEDLNSTNGTYVDGTRIEADHRRRLTSSSELSLGGEVTLTWADIKELRPSRREAGEGRRQVQASPKAPSGEYEPPAGYAGFWRRFGAALLDGLIVGVPLTLLQLAVIGAVSPTAVTRHGGPGAELVAFFSLQIVLYLFGVVIGWLYFAGFEASSYQATPGKMAIGLKVTGLQGEPISFLRATGRHFGKILSGIILYFGFFMAGWTEKHQALHDMISACLVVNDS